MAIVKLTVEAQDQLGDLPKEIQGQIRKAIKRLENWPTVGNVKRLKGKLADFFRLRVGDYRVRFCIKGDLIIVAEIGNRKDMYEN